MSPGHYYHIYNRGINRQLIFFSEENYFYFLQQFKKYLSDHIDVFSYCLMPNHFHFFIRVKEIQIQTKSRALTVIEKAFKNFFISYAKSINKRYKRTGALFQYKFKRKEIEDISHYIWLMYYIHANPVKAGLVKDFRNWKYSSYPAIISEKPTFILREEVIKCFGSSEEFVLFHTLNLRTQKKGEAWVNNFSDSLLT